MGYDSKYTDTDVKSDPFLLAAAVKYALSYRGDFDFMVAAADVAHLRGTLPVAIARGVLNCMRADPRVADNLPVPNNGHSEMLDKFSLAQYTEPVKVVPAWSERPRRYVSVRSVLKHMYMWSRAVTEDAGEFADKFHYTSARSGVSFYMPKHECELRIVSLCGVANSATKYLTGNTPPKGRILCGSCDRQIKLPKGYARAEVNNELEAEDGGGSASDSTPGVEFSSY